MQIARDVGFGLFASIPYVLIAQFGFGYAALFVYATLGMLAVRAADTRSFLVRFASMSVSTIVIGLTWILHSPGYAAIAFALITVGFSLPLWIAHRFRDRHVLAVGASTALFLAIILVLDVFRITPAFVSISWAVPTYASAVALLGHALVSGILFAASLLIVLDARARWFALCALIVLMLVGAVANEPRSLASPLDVAVIQSDFSEDWQWRQTNALDAVLKRLIDPTAAAISTGARFVVWPEHAIPIDVRGTDFDSIMENFTKRTNATVVIGTYELIEPESDRYYPGARVYEPGRTARFVPAYDPIGTNGHPVGTGVAKTIEIETDAGPITVGFLICYEEFTGASWLRDVDLVVVLSDYSDLGNTRLITKQATMVQSERFDVPIIRAVNSGPSLIIASDGSILDSGDVATRDVLRARVQ